MFWGSSTPLLSDAGGPSRSDLQETETETSNGLAQKTITSSTVDSLSQEGQVHVRNQIMIMSSEVSSRCSVYVEITDENIGGARKPKKPLALLTADEIDLHSHTMEEFIGADSLAWTPLGSIVRQCFQGLCATAVHVSIYLVVHPPLWSQNMASDLVGPKWAKSTAIMAFAVAGVSNALALLEISFTYKFLQHEVPESASCKHSDLEDEVPEFASHAEVDLKHEVPESASRMDVDLEAPQSTSSKHVDLEDEVPESAPRKDGCAFLVPMQRASGPCGCCLPVEQAPPGAKCSVLKSVQTLSALELRRAFTFAGAITTVFVAFIWELSEDFSFWLLLYTSLCVFPALWVMMTTSAVITITTIISKSMVLSIIHDLNNTRATILSKAWESGSKKLLKNDPELKTRWSDLGWKLTLLVPAMHNLWHAVSPLIAFVTVVFALMVGVSSILCTAAMVSGHAAGSSLAALVACASVFFFLKTIIPATQTTDMCTNTTDEMSSSLLAAFNAHWCLPWPVQAELICFHSQLQSSGLGARLPLLGQVSSEAVFRIGYILCTVLASYWGHLFVFLKESQ